MRRFAARVHLWGGLLTAPLLLVLGLSGSALVFAPEIEHALDGRPAVVSRAKAAAPSLDAVVAAALVAEPGAAPRALRLPARPEEPFVVELAVGGHRLDAAVDGSMLRVVDVRAPGRSPLVAVRSLHTALHGGRVGALVVGLLGLWLVVEGLTGLWLYGPSIARRVRGRSRIVHRVVGGSALVVGTVVGLTGALLVATALQSAGRAPVSSARLLRLDFVTARVPADGRVVALIAEPAHRVRVEILAPDGALSSVVVNADTGDRVAATTPHDDWDVIRRLHAGDFAGWPSRLLYAGMGLALPVLSVTGFLLSARRRA
jgi:uncharacterized iron-regulated membrane protein